MASETIKWDVFLSFRGEDTRRAFTSHLFSSLDDKGVNVFMDDRLQRGGDISTQLIDIIRGSRISVVVFSRNYADSRWCLQELCEIMDCRKNNTSPQVVLPVFYDASPSDVRKQTGDFGKVFAAKYEKNEEFARWKAVLTEAGSFSGWDLTNMASGSEAKIVGEIACRIYEELKNTYLDVAKDLVGLDSRVARLNEQLNDGSTDVRFIVISGVGGIGKTTLTKAIYNQFFHTFEAKCFLANVGESSKQHRGLVHLQEQLLHDTLKFQNIKVESIHRGSSLIKERLGSRRVLVVLDDITHRDQLNGLARERGWFGPGSRIIITTRDPDSVKEIKADYVYTLENLDKDESLELFSRHAFGCSHPKEEFFELSEAVVSYCEGLPLALEVLGAFLLDHCTVEEWKSEIDKLKRIPHNDIQKKLEISCQGLESDEELFLDIACFFVGWKKDYVGRILDGEGRNFATGMRILTRRNLVKISESNTLEMHNLIQDMGKEVVRKKSPGNPGERSRLFFQDDILKTLRSHLGTVAVEGIALHLSDLTEKVEAKTFSAMSRLRLLQLNNLIVDGDYGLFSKELRWLSWREFPLKFVPDGLYMGNLVALDMQYNKLRTTFKTSKTLENLKVLNLSHSHFLMKTPDFSRMPKLEELIMEDCRELKEIDGSIGVLESLFSVNLKDCVKLRGIPDSICRVKSLAVLNISGCSMIDHLPDDFGDLTSLMEFHADGVPIANLPRSFANLKNLSRLSLYGYNRLRARSISSLVWSWISKKEAPKENNQLINFFSGLSSLVRLNLEECDLSDDGILESIGTLRSLKLLRIIRSNFRHLPSSVISLPNLERLSIKYCPNVEAILDVHRNISEVFCLECPSLTEISFSGEWSPEEDMFLNGCKNLSTKCIDYMIKSQRPVSHGDLGKRRQRLLHLPGGNIPELFEYQSEASSLSFQFPSCHDCELTKVTVSYVFRARDPVDDLPMQVSIAATAMRQEIIVYSTRYFEDGYEIDDDDDYLGVFSVLPSVIMGDMQYAGVEVVLDIEPDPAWTVKAVGVHLDVEKCRKCRRLIGDMNDEDDAESAGSTDGGGTSSEYLLPEDHPLTDFPVIQHWLLRF